MSFVNLLTEDRINYEESLDGTKEINGGSQFGHSGDPTGANTATIDFMCHKIEEFTHHFCPGHLLTLNQQYYSGFLETISKLFRKKLWE